MYLVVVTAALSFSKKSNEAGQQLWQVRSEVITKADCNTNPIAEVITQADCNMTAQSRLLLDALSHDQ